MYNMHNCIIRANGTYNAHFSWQPESKFPFAQVRLPPKDGSKTEFQENQEIEVFSRSNDQEAWGWWKALIKVGKVILGIDDKYRYSAYANILERKDTI